MRKRTWTVTQLISAVNKSSSHRQVLKKLNLKPTGGNYKQLKKYIVEYGLNTNHFTGRLWNKGKKTGYSPNKIPLEEILTRNSSYQSYKLKNRLIVSGLKPQKCEECGWHKNAEDGRVPLELHHKNGISTDNRFENLSILCPNCHSLKSNHRGKNKLKY